MWHKLLIALTLLSLTPLGHGAGSAEYSVASPPAWVRVFAVEQDRDSKQQEGTHYLLYDRQAQVSDDGAEHYTRVVSRPLDSDALSARSQVEVKFDPTYQRLTLHGITVSRNGKVIEKLDSAEIKVVQQEDELEQQLFGGKLTVYIVLKDVRVNDTIDYAYTIHGANPVFGEKFFKEYSLGWSVPIDDLRVRVTMPEHRRLNYRLHRWEQDPDVAVEDGRRSYEWHIAPTKIIHTDSETPEWYKQRPSLQLSEYKDWAEVEQWASALFSSNEDERKALSGFISGWDREGHDRRDMILKALDFVQNEIRYFGFEFGENSHLPSPPGEVLENRYGDCKDKSLLLVRLLEQLGIEAYPALVSTSDRHAINDALPSPGVFDHAIVKMIIDNQEYWVDPTITRQVGGLEYRYVSNYGLAMVIGIPGANLDQVVQRGHESKIEMIEYFNGEKANEEMELVVKTSYFGPLGVYQRDLYSEMTKEKQSDSFANYYDGLYDDIDVLGGLGIDKSHNQPKLDLSEHYKLVNPWRNSESQYLLKTKADIVLSYLVSESDKARESPLSIGHPKLISYKAIITLDSSEMPAEREINEEVVIRDKVFSYRRTVTRNDNQLIVDHQYETKRDYVDVEDVPRFIERLKKVRKHLVYWVVIDKVEAIFMEDRMERIRAILRK